MTKNMIEAILELDRFCQFEIRELQNLEEELREGKISNRKFKEKSTSLINDIEWAFLPTHYDERFRKNKEFSLFFEHVQEETLGYLKFFEIEYKEALSTSLCDEEIVLSSETLCYQESCA